MRITIGTGTPSSLTAAITPCASTSHRRMPPKMLMSTAFTLVSDIRILNAFSNLLGVGAAADIQEVRRLPARQLDDVHRRHRQARRR